MEVGLLPALGDGIGALRRSGQDSRLIDGYLKPYASAFDSICYFSYIPETLEAYTDDKQLLSSLRLFAPSRRWPRFFRAFAMPVAYHSAFRRCGVFRVFQITGVIPALIAQALWGTPFITTYGFWYSRLSRPGMSRLAKRLLERVALRRAAGVIVPTEELRSHVVSLAMAGRVHLIPNGADTSRFAPGDRQPSPVRRILYVGRLEAEKNLPALITAAATLSRRFPLRLTFVGAGSLHSTLRAQAEALGVVTEFAGTIDHRSLPQQFRESDVFVLPSFTEGHPKVLIEAMASGTPCVVSNCPGNRSLVTHGETGLLFDPNSPDELASCIERVLTDESFGSLLGKSGRELIVARYDLGMLVAQEIALLQAVSRDSR